MSEITGHTEYKNLTSQQHKNFYGVFEKFISDVKPERILEIGTAGGGTTLALNDIMLSMNKTNRIRSYEVNDSPYYKKLYSAGIDLRIENIFNHEYNKLRDETKENVVEYIQRPGTTLILCDGGHKIGEFNELSRYLKVGDYIMAHDYAESQEYFYANIKNKIWDWCEITEEHIKEASEMYNLKRYMAEEFQSIVWVCKVKE
jgi:cephalosporin hydroxylase